MSANKRKPKPVTLEDKMALLLEAAKEAYEVIAGWANEEALKPWKIEEYEELSLLLENAIFTVEPDYEP